MPKLSNYVLPQQDDRGAYGTKHQQHAVQQQGAAAVAAAAAPEAGATVVPPPASSPPATHVLEHHAAESDRLQQEYSKRVREHGERMFRWPDGSLRPDKPPPDPHTAAARHEWAELVRHCRTHGGDRTFERSGRSLRYGLGVSHEEHAAHLQQIGLEPEAHAAGEQPGLDTLEDPEHCFHTFYREGAEVVFQHAQGRLL